jgi:hypothetical protein
MVRVGPLSPKVQSLGFFFRFKFSFSKEKAKDVIFGQLHKQSFFKKRKICNFLWANGPQVLERNIVAKGK